MNDSELATLVRRWVQAGRRDGVVRLAPVTEQEPPLDDQAGQLDDLLDVAGSGRPEPPEPPEPPGQRVESQLRAPMLPRRPTASDPEHATRLAVLIDARQVPEDVAARLLARLGERGSLNVCRAYADWSRSELGQWVGELRRQGLHSFHQFAADDDQALVAMAIDAVDIAREAAVDEVVIAGDMTSMLPLVHRLHAAGVRVVVVGTGHTPHDVRAACDEFIAAESLRGEPQAPAGRHRA